MKALLSLFVGIGLTGSIAFGFQESEAQNAYELRARVSSFVLAMAGVNGVGITGCDATTGEQNLDPGHVECLHITTETEEAYAALQLLYPVGTTVNGVFVSVRHVGAISIGIESIP